MIDHLLTEAPSLVSSILLFSAILFVKEEGFLFVMTNNSKITYLKKQIYSCLHLHEGETKMIDILPSKPSVVKNN